MDQVYPVSLSYCSEYNFMVLHGPQVAVDQYHQSPAVLRTHGCMTECMNELIQLLPPSPVDIWTLKAT